MTEESLTWLLEPIRTRYGFLQPAFLSKHYILVQLGRAVRNDRSRPVIPKEQAG